MKVYTNQADMKKNAEEVSEQNGFPLSTKCRYPRCMEHKTTLMMLIDDNDREVRGQRPPKVTIWPHDSMAIALYLCTECGEMTAEWDQA